MTTPATHQDDSQQQPHWQGRKVLVTGGGGFLGRYLVEQLHAAGAVVRTYSRNSYDFLDGVTSEQLRGDLQDEAAVIAACEGVDVVFHSAALAGIWGKWSTYYGINTLGTKYVLAGCQQHGVGRLVYTSSPSVTFDGADQCDVDESAPYPQRWLAHYPHSKALAEQDVLSAHHTSGLKTCALRPHLIWGPRDQHLIPRLIERARSGQLRQVGPGENLVDTIYVENAATAHLQAAEALDATGAPGGKAYFLSQGEPVNCWGWMNEVLDLAGLPAIRRQISFRAAYAIGATIEGIWKITGRTSEPRMTRFLAAQLAKHHYFDISAAREDFGFEPVISIAEGMQRLSAELAPQ